MQKTVYKQRLMLLLVALILFLCAGFIFISCGNDPQLKTEDPDRDNCAQDFGSCPGDQCRIIVDSDKFLDSSERTIEDKELTVEAWIKSADSVAANFNGAIVSRFDTAGIALYVKNGIPKAVIRRVGASGTTTATADYIASSNLLTDIADQAWHHIAGVLTADDHSNPANPDNHADCTNTTDTVDCTGATVCNNDIHLDIYVDGVYKDCNTTYGQSNDSTVTAPEYTKEPFSTELIVGRFASELIYDVDTIKADNGDVQPVFPGIIDEVRLWGTDRSKAEINACYMTDLGYSGICSILDPSLIAYMKFNRCEGEFAAEWSGLGTVGSLLYYPEVEWTTGWTTDTPF